MDVHPDLDEERRYLKRAYDLLDAMRQRTERVRNAGELAGTAVDSAIAQAHLSYRLHSLAESKLPLCFGRLDEEPASGSHTWYIGRRHVEDDAGDPVVVDWRAQVSTPFYRATFADPMGLARRRRFTLDGLDLVDLLDEDFDDPDSVGGGGGVPDPLLAELERARTGEMRDIVATIQAEQDVVIRAPLEDLIIVQGGPGTGKTAVGLHRAAFLLYEHRLQLDEQRVLVVGPNRVFLRYISQVLPSLGETAVVQTTIDGLVGVRYPVRGEDPPDVARVKGDVRMAEVVRRTCHGELSLVEHDVDASTPWGRVRITADEINELLMATLDRDVPLNVGREGFRRQVERLAVQRGPALHDEFRAALRRDRSFRTTLDKAWPSMSAPAVIRRLLGNARVLAEAADGLLTPEEQRLLVRRAAKRIDDEPWTEGDLPLLDEAEAVVSGTVRTYGHLVVDEAQDLSAMELRMLARRSPGGSMTILGDLAQATEVWGQRSWEEVLALLGAPEHGRIEELEIGYRVPGPILDFANRLLPMAAPDVTPSRSVRMTGDPPALLAVRDVAAVAATAAAEAARLAGQWSSVGVVAPSSLIDAVEQELAAAGQTYGDARRVGLDERLTVLLPPAAKGLEFDAVVVVEPAAIVEEEIGGARILYVALTRAVQHVSVVHARPLPEPLR